MSEKNTCIPCVHGHITPLLTAAGRTKASEAMRPPISVAIALFIVPSLSLLCCVLVWLVYRLKANGLAAVKEFIHEGDVS